MNENIAWVHRVPQIKWAELQINIELRREVDIFEDAEKALDHLLHEEYPLILVNEDVPSGELELPEGLSYRDSRGIACHVVERLRRDSPNREKPIVVLHLGGYIDTKRYREAGATDFIDWHDYGVNPPKFTDKLRKYL
jgi:hypothetical protein